MYFGKFDIFPGLFLVISELFHGFLVTMILNFTWLPHIVIAKANHTNLEKTVQITFHVANQVTLIVECSSGFKFPFHAVWENFPSQFHFTMEESAHFMLWEVEESACFANTLSFFRGGVGSFGSKLVIVLNMNSP